MTTRDPRDTSTDALARDLYVTFDSDELARFFDGFESIEEIALALCAPLGDSLLGRVRK